MDRYQDNISPEPNVNVSMTSCFKTPDLNAFHLNSILNLNSIYPTPPSDCDETNKSMSRIQIDATTPRISDNYYGESTSTTTSTSTSTSSILSNCLKSAEIINPQSSNSSIDLYNSNSNSNSSPNQYDDNSNVPPSKIKYEPTPNQQPNSRYKRRSRTTFSKSQLEVLEQTFQKAQYPEIKVVDDLSQMLNLSTERISIWFQNRRARLKKARKLQAQENGHLTDERFFNSKLISYETNTLSNNIDQPLQQQEQQQQQQQSQHQIIPSQNEFSNYYANNLLNANTNSQTMKLYNDHLMMNKLGNYSLDKNLLIRNDYNDLGLKTNNSYHNNTNHSRPNYNTHHHNHNHHNTTHTSSNLDTNYTSPTIINSNLTNTNPFYPQTFETNFYYQNNNYAKPYVYQNTFQ